LLFEKKQVPKRNSNFSFSQLFLTLNNGAKTAEPASPYSKAFSNCGRILFLQNDGGNESKDGVSLLKKQWV
jgi:hypothetical protein